MKYRFEDLSGDVFAGKTYAQVVSEMRQSSWQAPGKHAYMEGVARRIYVLDRGKTVVNIENAAKFIKSLVVGGWLRRVE